MSSLNLGNQIREEHLTCTICLNNFIKPKALPCLHTYCTLCLYDYVVSRGFESQVSFPCPTCRAETKMPETGIEGFPNNHLMSSLSDTVENASHSRPVPKPRRSLGVNLPLKHIEDDEPVCGVRRDVSPTAYSSVADTKPEASGLSKVCANDDEPNWMAVTRETPTAPVDANNICKGKDELFTFDVVSSPENENLVNPPISTNAGLPPVLPPSYTPSEEHIYTNINEISAQLPIGWNLMAFGGPNYPGADGLGVASNSINNDNHYPMPPSTVNNHSRPPHPASTSPQLYPAVPQSLDKVNVACTKNLLLQFGKQGSSNRDFLKPVGLTVSHDGKYIISDNAGDQNRIFIFNSGGELTMAFNCGCKVKDVTVSKKNEILAAVHKNMAAIRHFTMAGQCKGEYGKFFTFEEPCGIAELSNGWVALTGTQNHCVYVLTNQFKLSAKFGRKGNGDGYFQHPGFLTVDSKDHIIVTDKINCSVQIFEPGGKLKHRFGSIGSNHGQLQVPMGVCVDDADNIIVADSENFRVEVFSSKGAYLSTVVNNTNELGDKVRPVNVAFTPTGKVAVLLRGPYFAEVRVFSSDHKKHVHSEMTVSNFFFSSLLPSV